MAAINVVRFRVKPGSEQEFIDAHRKAGQKWTGFKGGHLVRTGEHTFCIVGEWASMKSMGTARPEMIAVLNTFRHTLEDLGNGMGVTDPVSGDVVLRLGGQRKKAAAKAPATKAVATKPAAKKGAAKKGAAKKSTATKRAAKKRATRQGASG